MSENWPKGIPRLSERESAASRQHSVFNQKKCDEKIKVGDFSYSHSTCKILSEDSDTILSHLVQGRCWQSEESPVKSFQGVKGVWKICHKGTDSTMKLNLP